MTPTMNGLDWFVTAIQATLFAYGLYHLVVSLAAVRRVKPQPVAGPRRRFALITAAHNESTVIGPHVENLLSLKYPSDHYQVFIIADNCTDETAAIARAAGATVLERRHDKLRGKGHALDWFFQQFLGTVGNDFDAVCLFDADNLVAQDFLQHMNDEINRGHRCIQGYIDSKNPLDSWVAACYSIMFWTTNRMYQVSRLNLGLSNYLGGTGMCIHTDLLRQHGWNAYSLTEDLEFTVKLVRSGERVWWCHEAKVYDEKPVLFRATWRQRLRWLQGHWLLCIENAWPMLQDGVRRRSWQQIDVALHLMHPPVQVLTGVALVIGSVHAVMASQGLAFLYLPWMEMLPSGVWTSFALAGYVWPLLAMVGEKVPLRAYIYYPLYIPFAMSWIPIAVWGWVKRHDSHWSHTKHTRAIRLQDLTRKQTA